MMGNMTGQSNPVAILGCLGQSVWLDFIQREFVERGELARMVGEDGIRGLTSNPAIFAKAFADGDSYTAEMARLTAEAQLSCKRIYEVLVIKDIQSAADVLMTVYEQSHTRDGYVSLEVDPHLARDTEATLLEARRLWAEVNRRNLMIKIPATPQGLPAIRSLIEEGINVNITLLFSRSVYDSVVQTFIEGIDARLRAGKRIDHVASVASFFVSRVDSAVDLLLSAKVKTADTEKRKNLESLLGTVAIANARLAYRNYSRIFSGSKWQELKSAGAQTQRLLWASTATKNPRYSDVRYVEELIGEDTVNTLSPSTLTAFRDHGQATLTLEAELESSEKVLANLADVGISLDAITDRLLTEGIGEFINSFANILTTISHKCNPEGSKSICS